jgi:hypothetical protein
MIILVTRRGLVMIIVTVRGMEKEPSIRRGRQIKISRRQGPACIPP